MSRATSSRSANGETLRPLQSLKYHTRVRKSPPLDSCHPDESHQHHILILYDMF
jgi:hypothetical protein